MATLAQFRSRVQAKLGLTATAAGAEETLLTDWINEGVVDVLVRTRVNVNCMDVALADGVWKYNLDTDILAIRNVVVNDAGTGQSLSPQRTTPADILWRRTRGGDDASAPMRWYALEGNDLLLVHPAPSTGDTLDVFYVPRPSPMTSGVHTPSTEALGGIPDEYHKAIELYALWQAAEFTDHQMSQFGVKFQRDYELWLMRIRNQARQKGGVYMGPAPIGRRRHVAHDPSTDWVAY